MRTIPVEPSLVHGAVSFEAQHGALWPLRFPRRDVALLDPRQRLSTQVRVTAGVRVRLATNANRLRLQVLPGQCQRRFDLVTGHARVHSVDLPAGAEWVEFVNIQPHGPEDTGPPQGPAALRCVEVWLPVKTDQSPTGLVAIEVDDGDQTEPAPDDRPRWTAYGSSITQCAAAHSPARTWPAIVARQHGLNLTCLGYGGACNLEPLAAMAIRDLPADFISLKLGINVHGSSSLNAISYPAAIHGLVRTVRQAHPATPIALVSPIISPDREGKPNQAGLTLGDYREMTRRAAVALNERADTRLYYFDGRELLGQADAHLLHDGLHPGGDGYELIADRFVRRVLSRIHVPGAAPVADNSTNGGTRSD